jgi:hypothetical protein
MLNLIGSHSHEMSVEKPLMVRALSFELQQPHTPRGERRLMVVTLAERTKLDLMAQRRPLAEQFEKNPHHLHLALEIKAIDDKIAECDQIIRLEREKSGVY